MPRRRNNASPRAPVHHRLHNEGTRSASEALAWIAPADLVTLRRNPQYLTPHQMEALKSSIARDGFLAPVLVRPLEDGSLEVVSGNHRVMAALELGLPRIPILSVPLDDRVSRRVAINLNTVHGNPQAELMAPFLADCDDDLLRTIHLDEGLLADVLRFDAELKTRLDEMEPPEEMDAPSITREQPQCVCPTCGARHAKK